MTRSIGGRIGNKPYANLFQGISGVWTLRDRVLSYPRGCPLNYLADGEDKIAIDAAAPGDLHFSQNGEHFYVFATGTDVLYWYTMSTPWKLSTATLTGTSSFTGTAAGQDNTPSSIAIGNNGTKLYMMGRTQDRINEYDLSTPYDPASRTYVNFIATAPLTNPWGLWLAPDGSKLLATGYTVDQLLQVDLPTPFSLAGATTGTLALNPPCANPYSSGLAPDGSRLFVLDSGADVIFEFALATPGDVTTAVLTSRYGSVGTVLTTCRGFFIHPDGDRLYAVGATLQEVVTFRFKVPSEL